ncbi:hypothetical protein TNCV_2500961 [Trichonephila clavipes]|nr:hypothetical protein TNCV_2500961 [Trichonephila clavipes]
MSSRIPTVTKSSTSIQAHLLPSTSCVAAKTSSESQPSIYLIDTAPATSSSLCTSVASSSSNKALSSSTVSMFSPLPAETSQVLLLKPVPLHPLPYFLLTKLKSKLQKFAEKSVLTEVLPQNWTYINGVSQTLKKKTSLQDMSDEDMLVYDVDGVEEKKVDREDAGCVTPTRYRK